MKLTRFEKEMLEGRRGLPMQRSMEILEALGTCFDADRMIPVASVHLSIPPLDACAAFVADMASEGARCLTYTTVNPRIADPESSRRSGIEIARKALARQSTMDRAFAQLGALPSYSCSPYLIGNVPRFGQHIAWSESSAAVFANSVLGARTNKEGGISAFAASLTGRTPEYGYHLDANRHGELEVAVRVPLRGTADYAVLGNFVALAAGDRVPVMTGVDPSVSVPELISLGTQMTTTGGVTLFHAVGVTPEAPTREAAFGRNKPSQKLEFGKKEYDEHEARLSASSSHRVDLVVFGCPHVSIDQLREISQFLAGKKVHPKVEVWVTTSQTVIGYGEAAGYVHAIESSGAKVLADACPMNIAMETVAGYGPRIVATNSGRVADAMPNFQGTKGHFGSTKRCLDAAISGVWK